MPDSTRRARDVSLAVGIALLLGAAGAEVALRVFFPAPADPEVIGAGETDGFEWRAAHPYVVFHSTPDADVLVRDEAWIELHGGPDATAHVVTDAHGFRVVGDVSGPKQAGELRVFLLGGSVVAMGMTNASTLSGVLGRHLTERLGDAVRVQSVGTGIMTAVSDQELAVLVHQVADLEPDIVIAYDGFNDGFSRQVFDPRLGYPAAWAMLEDAQRNGIEAARSVQREIAELPLWRLVLSRSRLATALAPRLRLSDTLTVELGEAVDHPRPSVDEVIAHWLGNWRKMQVISEAFGAAFIGVLQPMRPDERDAGQMRAFYDAAHEAVARANADGAPFYSFDRLFDDSPEAFFDPVHTYESGHERIAERLVEVLVGSGALELVSARAAGGRPSPGAP